MSNLFYIMLHSQLAVKELDMHFTRKVLILMKSNLIFSGDQLKADYLQINPNGVVPSSPRWKT